MTTPMTTEFGYYSIVLNKTAKTSTMMEPGYVELEPGYTYQLAVTNKTNGEVTVTEATGISASLRTPIGTVPMEQMRPALDIAVKPGTRRWVSCNTAFTTNVGEVIIKVFATPIKPT